MGLLDILLGINNENKKDNSSLFGLNDNKKKEVENKKDNSSLFGLNDNEKKEIEKGNYEPWNFEEEELEEDDYYSEDDKD